jgi:hypothetical protein
MVNTNCSQCIFANKIDNNIKVDGCQRDIIKKIIEYKDISLDSNNFNIINNYACKFGFSKNVYEKHKIEFDKIDLLSKIDNNAKLPIYLAIDCVPGGPDLDLIIDHLAQSNFYPKFISILFRDKSNQNLDIINDNISSKIPNATWKIHNFLENINLNDSIDHILSTNLSKSQCSYLLVYKSSDYQYLNTDLLKINESVVLHQIPHIAMVKSLNNLYGLAISVQNYIVAKSINTNILDAILTESAALIHY